MKFYSKSSSASFASFWIEDLDCAFSYNYLFTHTILKHYKFDCTLTLSLYLKHRKHRYAWLPGMECTLSYYYWEKLQKLQKWISKLVRLVKSTIDWRIDITLVEVYFNGHHFSIFRRWNVSYQKVLVFLHSNNFLLRGCVSQKLFLRFFWVLIHYFATSTSTMFP